MGRVGSALDNATAESFLSTLEHELLSPLPVRHRDQARHAVAGWIDGFYSRIRRHSTIGMRSPVDDVHRKRIGARWWGSTALCVGGRLVSPAGNLYVSGSARGVSE